MARIAPGTLAEYYYTIYRTKIYRLVDINISCYINEKNKNSLRCTLNQLMELGTDSLAKELYGFCAFGSLAATKQWQLGTNVYDRDWDLLVVLDCCRVDALEAVRAEYDFIGDVGAIWSVGSTSKEWIANTFQERYSDQISETTYITANGFAADVLDEEPDWTEWGATQGTWMSTQRWLAPLVSRDVVDSDDLDSCHRIWDLSDRHEHGHTPYAEDVTDYTIRVGRAESPTKTIVHYMQPHAPYLANRSQSSLDDWQAKPLEELRNGGDKDRIWAEYLDNLRYVLDEVARLLENFSAQKVVITADHGELFGEFGLHDHGVGILHPALRKVPWAETTARDTGTVEPEIDIRTETSGDVKETLRNLGYFE
ncbi:sulfatase-like hydrolase/transferase [Haloarcula sp. S1CR25-12]|uniref:Sulfatase-like hydrolase/transferase n=1 Tax=Haloarcula saliterrae TaxID=2950534 RepID=A0ABU2FIB0_9EURY|nr:sulfatase-like hydrolase/transferase [Haloarcula sp. S1CR25-12]MDS0261440.1 sulfatase-like hydrolase/transferase [Haloarcula sp. S1CR25-12]